MFTQLPPDPKTPSRSEAPSTGEYSEAGQSVALCLTSTRCATAQNPAYPTAAQVSAEKHTREPLASGIPSSATHAKRIKRAYVDHIHWDVDVHDFIKVVFPFDWTEILPESCEGSVEGYKQSASEVQKVLEAPGEAKTCDSTYRATTRDAIFSGASGPKDTIRAKGRLKASSERRAKKLGGTVPVRTYVRKVGVRTGEAISEHRLKETTGLIDRMEENPKPSWEWAMVPMVMGVKNLSETLLIKEDGGILLALVCPDFLWLCFLSQDTHGMASIIQVSHVRHGPTKPARKTG